MFAITLRLGSARFEIGIGIGITYLNTALTSISAVVAAALIPRLDLFISLIGALASSCLAIIFPAIIQMCTFWRYRTCDDDEDNDRGYEDSGGRSYQEGACSGMKEQQQTRDDDASTMCRQQKAVQERSLLSGKKRFFWSLFICKNLLLIVFGILGLITGSWISISQLSSAYLGLESASWGVIILLDNTHTSSNKRKYLCHIFPSLSSSIYSTYLINTRSLTLSLSPSHYFSMTSACHLFDHYQASNKKQ